MITLLAFILAIIGFASLALSMHRHHRDLFGHPPSRVWSVAFTLIGWCLLPLSFWACIIASGWAIGPVVWIGFLTLAALIIILALTFGPGYSRAHQGKKL
ncbi:MAG: DUF3325 domain-containing protein [Alphaproteobacteria bacterium]|nr:DUF3325 domain-containing protein [Alphaproteobacteria bacterium]